MAMTMHELPSYSSSWEGGDNPSDLSGVARFKVRDESVSVAMRSFADYARLDSLIQKACDLRRQQALECAILGVSDLLSKHRYD
jgi:hypothetical protein